MGLVKGLRGSTKTRVSEEDLVYTEDKDGEGAPLVMAPAELVKCGWVPQKAVNDKPGVDVVRVRALNGREKSAARDLYARQGEASMNLEIVARGIVRVNRETSPEAIRAYADALAAEDPMALDLLARYIDAKTMLQDPASGYAFARAMLGYVAPPAPAEPAGPTPAEVSDDAGASKSAG